MSVSEVLRIISARLSPAKRNSVILSQSGVTEYAGLIEPVICYFL